MDTQPTQVYKGTSINCKRVTLYIIVRVTLKYIPHIRVTLKEYISSPYEGYMSEGHLKGIYLTYTSSPRV